MDKNEIIEEFVWNLSDEDKEEWLESRKNCDKSLFYFIKEMGGCLLDSKGNSIAGGDSIEYLWRPICNFWQDNSIKRKFVYEPRRWLKSTNRKWGQVWTYLQNNETRILTASEVEKRPKEWLAWQGKQLLSHPRLRWVYPELRIVNRSWKQANTFNSEQILLPRNGIYDAPTFAGIGIHGSSQGGHYDIIEPDDICGEKAMESAVIMEDAFRWFDNIDALLTDPSIDIIRGMGTYWALGDLGWYVQKEFPEYQWIIVPALKDEELEDSPNIRYLQNPEASHGESNWEARGSTKYYLDMMSNPQTQMKFWTQEQNNPAKAGGGLNKFDIDWVNWYKWEEIDGDLYLRCTDDKELFKLTEIHQYGILDMGGFKEIKLIKKGSVNVQLIGGRPRNSIKKFITYYWEGKLKEPSIFVDGLVKAHEALWPHHWEIEPYGQHEFIRKYLVEETKKRGKNIRIWPIELTGRDVSDGAKHSRITDMIPMVANGELYLHESFKPLIDGIKTYPNCLTFDGLDSLGWLRQLHWATKSSSDIEALNRRLEQQRIMAIGNSRTGY